MSRRSRTTPRIREMSGGSDDCPGLDDVARAIEKTLVAAYPNAPGRSQRHGATEDSNGLPNTIGMRAGPRTAATTMLQVVLNARSRGARSASCDRTRGAPTA